MRTPILLGLTITVALALAGCTSPAPAPTAASLTPTPSASVSPTPTPTPTPTAERADYGFTFYEDADLGATWTQMSAQLGYPVTGDADCPWFGPVDRSDPHVTYAFADSRDASLGTTFFYSQAQPDVTDYPRNAEGVGIGSTQAQLLAAYPAAVVGTTHDLGAGDLSTVTVTDPASGSTYVFAFSGGSSTVDLLQWGSGAGTQWSHLCTGF